MNSKILSVVGDTKDLLKAWFHQYKNQQKHPHAEHWLATLGIIPVCVCFGKAVRQGEG